MLSFAQFGNDLYTGKRSYDFVGKRRIWFIVASIGVLLAILVPIARGGFNLGIDFRGGNEFRVVQVTDTDTSIASNAVQSVLGANATVPQITVIGTDTIRIQTEKLSTEDSDAIKSALATGYNVPSDDISVTSIDATWGADVTNQALRALVVFLLIVTVVMALYFRTWKMSIAALIALFHDLIITAGVYAATGFEVTPSAVIGFLTILGYSLYDTVVVFDKVRENTADITNNTRMTFAEAVNLAVNQTLVRSINTSVVALLPVGSILVIGAFVLGAGTLRDISLALFIGILVGTYSTIFIASPLYAQFRMGEKALVQQAARVEKLRSEQ